MAKLISSDLTNNKLCIFEYTTTDGQMLSFKEDAFDATIVSHTYTDIGKVIFDKPITRIGDYAFYFCRSLTSVTIPDSVTTIGESAFDKCDSLTSVTIPDSVTTIESSAFSWCTSLTSVTIPDSVTTIGKIAFWRCNSLTSVTIGNGVTTIGEGAFLYCTSLTSVTIPDSVTTIGKIAFWRCTSLKEFKGKFAADGGRCLIIDGVLNAFAIGCGVTQYTIPDSVTTIGKFAFVDCFSLTSVTIGKGVSEIGADAFKGCNIDTIVCRPEVPPKIDDSFDKFENLIVPTGCEEAYANSDWGQYLE